MVAPARKLGLVYEAPVCFNLNWALTPFSQHDDHGIHPNCPHPNALYYASVLYSVTQSVSNTGNTAGAAPRTSLTENSVRVWALS